MARGRGERRMHVPSVQRTGRPTRLTPELTEKIRLAVRGGATLKAAAQSQRVGYSTVLSWMQRGEQHARRCEGADEWDEKRRTTVRPCRRDGHEFLEFLDLIEQAKAEDEVAASAQLTDAARRGDVKAIAMKLRRLAPNDWIEERKLKLETGGRRADPNAPLFVIEVVPSDRDPKELRDALAALEAPASGPAGE